MEILGKQLELNRLMFAFRTRMIVTAIVNCMLFLTTVSVNAHGTGRQTVMLTPSGLDYQFQINNLTMKAQTRTAVSTGSWGGDGIRLEIENNSSALQFACADGVITERLFQDADGNFSATGTFTRRTPGPQREGGNAAQMASFVGRITGRSMTIKIELTDSKSQVGEFSLELDKKVRLQRCL